jgi:uncharacterized protein DUF4192
VLDDPATSAAAAAAVAAGHRMYGTREELKASVAVDVERAAGLAPLLAGAGGAVECVAVSVREAVAAVRRVGEGAVLSDAELAGVAATLVDVRVRDALFTMADSDEAAAAEMLRSWRRFCRSRSAPKHWFCSASARTCVARGLWSVWRWRPRSPPTRRIGWRACSTTRCRTGCDPTKSAARSRDCPRRCPSKTARW